MIEAFYYSGERCLIEGRTWHAKQRFTRCVSTGLEFDLDAIPIAPMNEDELAGWRLRILRRDTGAASAPPGS